MQITITGPTLVGRVTIAHARPDDRIHGEGWLLDIEQAAHVLDAWKYAPARGAEVVREWAHYDIGLIVTALCLDGELILSSWEAATGSDGADVYSTTNMPFDFDIHPTDADAPFAQPTLTPTEIQQ